jgi:hypothetical protein
MFKHYPDRPFYCVRKHGRFTAQKVASAETFRDSCRAQGPDKRDKPLLSPQIMKIKIILKIVSITFQSMLYYSCTKRDSKFQRTPLCSAQILDQNSRN